MATVIPDSGMGFQKVYSAIIDDSNNLVDVDRNTNSLKMITTPHYEVHKGNMYDIGWIFEEVADNTFAYLSLEVPIGKEFHTIVATGCEGDAHMHLYEGGTLTGGNQLTIHNMHRGSSNSSAATALASPGVSATATTLVYQILPGGERVQAVGGVIREGTEWILKSGKYIVGVVNKAGSAKTIGIQMQWYELNV